MIIITVKEYNKASIWLYEIVNKEKNLNDRRNIIFWEICFTKSCRINKRILTIGNKNISHVSWYSLNFIQIV